MKTPLLVAATVILVAMPAWAQRVTPDAPGQQAPDETPVEGFMMPLPTKCTVAEIVFKHLNEKYGELAQMAGTQSESAKSFVVTANPETHTWTIVMLVPEFNAACIVADGANFSNPGVGRTTQHKLEREKDS